jgi:hypothetical protein
MFFESDKLEHLSRKLNNVEKLKYSLELPVTVAEVSKACTAFACSEAGIVGSNPTQGMDVWYVYVYILCLCFPVFR